MKDISDFKPHNPDELRRLAEDLARTRRNARRPTEPGDLETVMHELEVHQIELELQNLELRRALVAAERAQAQFFRLFNLAPIGYVVLNESGIIVRANETFCRMGKHPLDAVLNHAFAGFLADTESRDTFLGRFRAIFKNPLDKRIELKLRRSDNTSYFAQIEGATLDDAQTEAASPQVSLLLAVTDISERRFALNALQTERARFFAMLATLPVPLYLQAEDYSIAYANPAFKQAFGDPANRLCYEVLQGLSAPCSECQTMKTLRTGQPGNWEWTDRNGRTFLVFDRMFGDELGRPQVLEILIDITDRKRAEEEREKLQAQMLLSQKLESIGVLAGGIAHDFNNLLCAILGNIELASMHLPGDSAPASFLGKAVQSVKRSADLCRQLLAYSGRGKFVVQPLDMNEIVKEMGALLEISVTKKARLRMNLGQGLPAIEGDGTQVRQVVMNLLINASEALDDRAGLITLTTGTQDCQPADLQQCFITDGVTPGRFTFVEVQDTGIGMDEDTLRRIFDPFFTTKFTGRGLGLSAVLGIVRGHHGTLRITSTVGVGTAIRILFPAVAGSASVTPAATEPATSPEPLTGCILIVDDDQALLSTTAALCQQWGLTTLTAEDGEAALELCSRGAARQDQQHIDVVLLDLTMPKMSGDEVFEQLLQIAPGLPVIIASGYSEVEISARFADRSVAGILQKPFTAGALRRLLTSILPRS